MISVYFTVGGCRMRPFFQSPLVGPCLHTHTELQKGHMLKPEPGASPKSQDRTRIESDILFLKPNLGLKAKFTEGVKICAIAE